MKILKEENLSDEGEWFCVCEECGEMLAEGTEEYLGDRRLCSKCKRDLSQERT